MSQADNSHTTIATGLLPRAAKPRPKRISPAKQRKLVETAIERLVELLDEIDPDSDLEDNGDGEPSLGWPIPQEKLPQRLNTDAGLSGDAGDDRELDTADSEPSLGSLTSCGWYASQAGWAVGNTDDREDQCEDEGAEHDGREEDGR